MNDTFRSDVDPTGFPSIRDTDDRFRAVFDGVNDGIFIIDPTTGRFREINHTGNVMFGYTGTELVGCTIETLSSGVHPYSQDVAIEYLGKAMQGEPQIFEWECKTRDGGQLWAEVSIRHVTVDGVSSVVAITRNISERKRLDAQIVYMAHHDLLTGLANRSMFMKSLEEAISHAYRSGKQFAVMCLDLDHFKGVNDTRGHLTGDRLLRLVAERLQSCVRQGEMVARFGGDEFAILLDKVHDPATIASLANRIVSSIGKPFSIDGHDLYVGASIGVAIHGEDAFDAETLLSHADMALYRAKAEGRHTYRFYSEAVNNDVRSRVTAADELRRAIASGELFLVYQPQVRCEGNRIIGAEALVRWQHPQRGVLLPAEFLGVAENSGLSCALGEWVLREACRQGRKWLDAGIAPDSIAVNLSSAQLKAPLDFEKTVLSTLAETGLPPRMLELEITEAMLINLSPQHIQVIQRLRGAGVRMSLDDFGTGYSSLHYLRQFSVNRIKIAQEFVAEIADSVEAASIVKMIVGLSRGFGSEVIAEGVETKEQFNRLRDMDCADVQGYYLSRPLSAEAMGHLMVTGTAGPSENCEADPVHYLEASGSLQPSGSEEEAAAAPSEDRATADGAGGF
jgi:diguanylate cyclase (GGDEF)-like protein/PAS domain S-box-containing protein